jgi:hypothetical protein
LIYSEVIPVYIGIYFKIIGRSTWEATLAFSFIRDMMYFIPEMFTSRCPCLRGIYFGDLNTIEDSWLLADDLVTNPGVVDVEGTIGLLFECCWMPTRCIKGRLLPLLLQSQSQVARDLLTIVVALGNSPSLEDVKLLVACKDTTYWKQLLAVFHKLCLVVTFSRTRIDVNRGWEE